MGFLLSALYILLTYLSPAEMIPALAEYRPMVVLGALALVGVLVESGFDLLPFTSPLGVVLAGFIASVVASRVFNGWLGGGWPALMAFLPAAGCFYLLAGSVKTMFRLRMLVSLMLCSALYAVTMGAMAYHGYAADKRFIFTRTSVDNEENFQPADVPGDNSLLADDEGSSHLIRARALGFLNDPNDFAQFLDTLIPLCFVWWRAGNPVWNMLTVLAPCCYMGYGIFLTHSRGGVVGVALVAALAGRRHLGTIGSAVLVVALIAAMLALNFSGGRAISVSGGSDRLELWSAGLSMFKQSPVWGVGFGQYADSAGLTAHNSFILCLAELGMLGYILWLCLLLLNVYYLRTLTSSVSAESLTPEFVRTAKAVALSFTGFIATSFFLSRSYYATLYILLGLTVALQRMASSENSDFPLFQTPRWVLVRASGVAVASLALFYVAVNLR